MLRNRIVSTPHATGWGRDGLIDPREVDYHVRKAAGGCALVMTFGSASVDPTTAASYGSISLWDERNEPALRALADGVHGHGALCMSQMTHMGRRGTSTLTGIPLRAPSDLPEGVHLEVPVPLAVSEIPAIVQRFADAAARLERCGWDGCEVTSFGGHLIEQFFDPAINTRTDEYGGSLENRTRFGREVLEAVRAAVSDTFIVGFRMAADQCLTGGLGPDELIEVARSLAATGAIDLFSVSGGTGASRLSTAYFVPGDELPEGVFNERARRFREAVGVPVIVAGRNVEPAMADACVASGVDLVAMTRAIIADPDLPAKARAGRAARPCIGINEGCIGRLYTDRPMWCSVNPGIRDPELAELVPAATTRTGRRRRRRRGRARGGARRGAARSQRRAASSAARSSADAPASPAPDAGGSAGRATSTGCGTRRRPPARSCAPASRRRRRTCSPSAPDAVILATGSELRPSAALPGPVPAIDVDALLEHGVPEVRSRSALVLDDEGGFLAPTAAERLVAEGFTVEIATTHPVVGAEIDPTQQPFVFRRLALAGVVMTPHLSGVSSDADGVTLRNIYTERDERREGVGLVVMAGYRHGVVDLRDQLTALQPELRVVVAGDALAPRTLLDAVAEGARAGADV